MHLGGLPQACVVHSAQFASKVGAGAVVGNNVAVQLAVAAVDALLFDDLWRQHCV